MTDIAVLNHAEQVALDECERVIGAGLKTFVEVGSALAFVRENQLYRGTHQTFEVYARERWSLSRPRAYELMTAAEVVSAMADTDGVPTNERQARELAKVPEPERAEVWRETVESTEGKPTAAAIRKVHTKRTQTPGPTGAEHSPLAGSGTTPVPAVRESPVLTALQEPDPSPEPVDDPTAPSTGSGQGDGGEPDLTSDIPDIDVLLTALERLLETVLAEVEAITAEVDLGEHAPIVIELAANLQTAVELLASCRAGVPA